jgi:hypothetical protein
LPPAGRNGGRKGRREDDMVMENIMPLDLGHNTLLRSEGLFKVKGTDPNIPGITAALQNKQADISYESMGNEKRGIIYGYANGLWVSPMKAEDLLAKKKNRLKESSVEEVEMTVMSSRPAASQEELAKAFGF